MLTRYNDNFYLMLTAPRCKKGSIFGRGSTYIGLNNHYKALSNISHQCHRPNFPPIQAIKAKVSLLPRTHRLAFHVKMQLTSLLLTLTLTTLILAAPPPLHPRPQNQTHKHIPNASTTAKPTSMTARTTVRGDYVTVYRACYANYRA